MFLARLFQRDFSSAKYYLDSRYKNFKIQTDINNQLTDVCDQFAKLGIQIVYPKPLRSNPTKNYFPQAKQLDISIVNPSQGALTQLLTHLSKKKIKMQSQSPIQIPWFPTNLRDLNKIGKVLLPVDELENQNHEGFKDLDYRARRQNIVEMGKQFKMGDKIPNVPYSKQQEQLWKYLFRRLRNFHNIAMCDKYKFQMQKLQKDFPLTQNIPQLQDLSDYLQDKTGFTLKPTIGILSQRQFLNALAFKVFCCTQYIRHPGTPDYTPEPDVVHEIIGHIPMFADQQVADFSHKIGLLSLGATDKQIAQLGALYLYIIQFGVCQQNGKKLGYGAGIAGCVAEMEHMMSSQANFKNFDPDVDCDDDSYPIQDVQHLYRVTNSFGEALRKIEMFGQGLRKPIETIYNEKTKNIEYNRNIQGVDFGDKGPLF